MTRIHDDRFREAHTVEQGDFIIASNECCAVIGNGKARQVSVSFFAYRWRVEDKAKAASEGELLRARMDEYERAHLTGDTLVGIASLCLEHYKRGEREGWLIEIEPEWKHDCDDCIFLGPLLDKGNMPDSKDGQETEGSPVGVDLYYCPNARPFPTVIARHGSDGPEYKSGLLFGQFGLDPHLAEAFKRANAYGLTSGVNMPRLNVIDQGSGQVPSGVRE